MKRQNYTVLGTFKVNEVFPFLVDPLKRCSTRTERRRNYTDKHGQIHSVNMQSHRLWTFFVNGISCVSCGITGEFFSLEKDVGNKDGPPHFNLYAIDDTGQPLLMTKDHIIPVSKGGRNTQSNFQTMCTTCNAMKGDK